MANPFQTPPNEQSFSSLIDDAVLATGKPGSLISVIQQANLTIRECQGLGLFARDMVEDTLTVDVTPFTWNRPPFFRKLRTANYSKTSNGIDGCYTRWPKFLMPGKIQNNERDYFYAADNYFVFNGVCLGELVNTATYYWSAPLQYFGLLGQNTVQYPGGPYNTRLAYFDLDTMIWMYLNAAGNGYVTTTGNPVTDASYQALSTNWLISDWRQLILSGTKAKVFGSSGDSRAAIEYSLYKQTQAELRITSGLEADGF